MVKLDKVELRKLTIAMLKEFREEERKTIADQLMNHLITSTEWKRAKRIGITISQGFEWDTKPIIEEAWNQGKTVAVPKCVPKEKLLTFYQFNSYDQLETVYYNLLEPNPDKTIEVDKNKIDLLIVPGLLFDKRGYRVGFGGGYYDRFLVGFPNQTVSLTSTKQLVESLPAESFDIPVNHLITENGSIT